MNGFCERIGLEQQRVVDDCFGEDADLGEDEGGERRSQKTGDSRFRPDRDQLTQRDEREDDGGSVDCFHEGPFELKR